VGKINLSGSVVIVPWSHESQVDPLGVPPTSLAG
jgi:hypothetical protein